MFYLALAAIELVGVTTAWVVFRRRIGHGVLETGSDGVDVHSNPSRV